MATITTIAFSLLALSRLAMSRAVFAHYLVHHAAILARYKTDMFNRLGPYTIHTQPKTLTMRLQWGKSLPHHDTAHILIFCQAWMASFSTLEIPPQTMLVQPWTRCLPTQKTLVSNFSSAWILLPRLLLVFQAAMSAMV